MEVSKNTVTLTREEFNNIAKEVITEGEFVTRAIEEDAKFAFAFMLTGIPIIKELETALFGEGEN